MDGGCCDEGSRRVTSAYDSVLVGFWSNTLFEFPAHFGNVGVVVDIVVGGGGDVVVGGGGG
jgi:hypothetical protein